MFAHRRQRCCPPFNTGQTFNAYETLLPVVNMQTKASIPRENGHQAVSPRDFKVIGWCFILFPLFVTNGSTTSRVVWNPWMLWKMGKNQLLLNHHVACWNGHELGIHHDSKPVFSETYRELLSLAEQCWVDRSIGITVPVSWGWTVTGPCFPVVFELRPKSSRISSHQYLNTRALVGFFMGFHRILPCKVSLQDLISYLKTGPATWSNCWRPLFALSGCHEFDESVQGLVNVPWLGNIGHHLIVAIKKTINT